MACEILCFFVPPWVTHDPKSKTSVTNYLGGWCHKGMGGSRTGKNEGKRNEFHAAAVLDGDGE
jgi:hypothetical protein